MLERGFMKKEINFGIGFITGRPNICKIINNYYKYLIEQVESEDIQTITNTISLDMEKEDGDWKMTTDTTVFTNAVLPGLMDKINETQSALSEED